MRHLTLVKGGTITTITSSDKLVHFKEPQSWCSLHDANSRGMNERGSCPGLEFIYKSLYSVSDKGDRETYKDREIKYRNLIFVLETLNMIADRYCPVKNLNK